MRLKRNFSWVCLLVIVLSALAFFNCPSPVLAASDEIQVFLNGQTLTFDQPPVILGGRTMVPMAAIFNALGSDVKWDSSTQTVTARRGDTTVVLVIGMQSALVNGHETPLSQAAQIIGGRTMVPLAFVAQALGADVQWDGATRTVTIKQEVSGGSTDITGKQLVDYFFSSLRSSEIDDALGMMDPETLGNASTQAMWRGTFTSFASLTVNNIEDWNPSEWSSSQEIYKVSLNIHLEPNEQTLWSDGDNTRWVYVKKVNNQWKISELATGP